MYFTTNEITEQFDQLCAAEHPADVVIQCLKAHGFEITTFENGTIFALLLGDMPSREGSAFVTGLHDLPSLAQLLALSAFVTEKRDYKNTIHHPDIELVFLSDWTEAAAPNFMKIYSPNAYLLEEKRAIGTLLSASDPIVKDRYHTVIEGLRNHYSEAADAPSVMNRLFQEHEIRTVSISYGETEEEYAKNADAMMYLSVAYQE